MADWNRAKDHVDKHLEQKTKKFQQDYERKKLRQQTMKNLSLQQPSESIGEEQDSDELDLGDDDIDVEFKQVLNEQNAQPKEKSPDQSEEDMTKKSDSKETGKMETPFTPQTDHQISLDCHDKKAHCGNHYATEPRTKIEFRNICTYLKNKEISCQKYNYSLASLVQN